MLLLLIFLCPLSPLKNSINPSGNLYHVFFVSSSGSFRRCTQTKAGRVHGTSRVKWYGVFVHNNSGRLQFISRFPTTNSLSISPNIHTQKMRLCPSLNHSPTEPREFIRKRSSIFHNLLSIFFKSRTIGLLQGNRYRRNLIEMWTTLKSRVKRFFQFFLKISGRPFLKKNF